MKIKRKNDVELILLKETYKAITKDDGLSQSIKKIIIILCEKFDISDLLLMIKYNNFTYIFYKGKNIEQVNTRSIVLFEKGEERYTEECMLETLVRNNKKRNNLYLWHIKSFNKMWDALKANKKSDLPKDIVPVLFYKKKRCVLMYYPHDEIKDGITQNMLNELIKSTIKNVVLVGLSEHDKSKAIRKRISDIFNGNSVGEDIDTFYRNIVSECKDKFQAQAASLYLQNQDGNILRAVAGVGPSEYWIDDFYYTKIGDDRGITLRTWIEGETFRWSYEYTNLSKELSSIAKSKGGTAIKKGNEKQNCLSIIAVPIFVGKECMGVLKVERIGNPNETWEPFRSFDQRKLEAVANVFASHIAKNKYHYDEIVFGRKFFEKLFNACEHVRNKNKDSKHYDKIKKPLDHIKEFATGLRQSKCSSRDELFEFVKRFYIKIIEHIKADVSKDLTSVIENLPDIEKVLYRIPKYRDHLIHQVQVFLLGFLILAYYKEIEIEEVFNLEDEFIGYDDCTWMERWFFASAFHDIGYSFEKIEEWPELLFNTMLNENPDDNNKNNNKGYLNWGNFLAKGEIGSYFEILLEHIYSTFDIEEKRSIQIKVRQALLKETVVRPCHSTIGALLFLHHTNCMGDCHGTKTQRILKDAAVAICLHETGVASEMRRAIYGDKKDTRLKFKNAPFAFLLMFCDTIHNWGREKPDLYGHEEEKLGAPEFIKCLKGKDSITNIILSYKPEKFSKDIFGKIYNGKLEPLKEIWSAQDKFKIEYHRGCNESNIGEPHKKLVF